VAVDRRSGDLYIADGHDNARVHRFSADGRHLLSWGAYGTDPGQFNLPHNVATDAEGRVYVADRENHRIQVFDEQGKYLDQWNNLHRPCGLHTVEDVILDQEGRLYVSEDGSGSIIVIEPEARWWVWLPLISHR
jgi:DNA-binding beta-propeller fold protein YncE